MIDFRRGRTAIVGMTGTGKTYTASHYLSRWPHGVIFVNTMHNMPPKGFTMATGKTDINAVMEFVGSGGHVCFNPARDADSRNAQIAALVGVLEARRRKDMLLAVDEIHLYRKRAADSLISIATTGRGWGVTLVPITQRLAKLDNDIMTQCEQKIIFFLENEEQYCARYGIPYSEIEKRILAKSPPKVVNGQPQPPHAYCAYYMGQINGAYML